MEQTIPLQSDEKTRGNSIFILIVSTLLYIVNYMDRTVLSVTLPLIKEELLLTDTQLGWLGSIYFIMVAFLTIPSALLIDRWSRKKALAGMAVVWSVATFWTGMGRAFLPLLGARGLVGIGEAGFAPGGSAYVAASFKEKHRAKVTGIFAMGAPIGLILGAVLGGQLAQADFMGLGWRAPYYFFAIPGILLGILVLFTRDYTTDTPKEFSNISGIFKDMKIILRLKTFWFLAVGFGINSFGGVSVLQFIPIYLMRTRGWELGKASSMFGLMFLFSAIGTVLVGIFSDRLKARHINGRVTACYITALISSISLALALFADHNSQFLVGFIFLTISAASGFSVLSPVLASCMDLAPLRLRSLSVALMLFVGFLLSSPGPTVIGKLSDAWGTLGNPNIQAAFNILPLVLLLATFVFFLAARGFLKEFHKIKNPS